MADLQRIGKYQLLEEIGRGGFAAVFRALDTTLEREVALKVLKPGWTDDSKAVERFMREARVASRLDHPGIVTIYEVGEADGRLYIAMKLLPGQALDRLIKSNGPLSWARTLNLLAQVADALDYAHAQGLVHRDIKPANLIVDENDRVVLTDFGLVRGAEQASLSTGTTGGILGTPEYIPPEVWEGQPATKASDIYSLACVVYEMLIGRPLFAADTGAAVMRKHLISGPEFPLNWPPGVPDEISAVLRKALAHDANARYATAREIIGALQESKQEAREACKMQEAKAAERKAREDQEREAARLASEAAAFEAQAKHMAEEKNKQKAGQSSTTVMSKVKQPTTTGETSSASPRLSPLIVIGGLVVIIVIIAAVAGAPKPAAPIPNPTDTSIVTLHSTNISTAASSPTNTLVPVSTVKPSPTFTLIPPSSIPPTQIPLALAGTPVIRPLAIIAARNVKQIAELARWKVADGAVSRVAFSPNGQLLAAAINKEIKVWNILTGKEIATLKGHTDEVHDVAFSPQDNSVIASASGDGTIKLWNISSGQEPRTIDGSSNSVSVNDIAFSLDGKHIAAGVGGNSQNVKMWSVSDGHLIRSFSGLPGGVMRIALSPDGNHIAAGNVSDNVSVWNTANGSRQYALEGSTLAFGLAFSPDSKHLAAQSAPDYVNYTLKIWDAVNHREEHSFFNGTVRDLVFSPNGQLLAAVVDADVFIWETSSRNKLSSLVGHTELINNIAFSTDSTMIATASNDGTIRLWGIR